MKDPLPSGRGVPAGMASWVTVPAPTGVADTYRWVTGRDRLGDRGDLCGL